MSARDPNRWSKRQADQDPGADPGTKGSGVNNNASSPGAASANNSQPGTFEPDKSTSLASSARRQSWNIVEEVQKRPASGPGLGTWYLTPIIISIFVFCGYRYLTDRQTIGTLKFVKENRLGMVSSLAPQLVKWHLPAVAEELYRVLADTNPKDPAPPLEIALLEQTQGKNDQAIKDLQAVLAKSGPGVRSCVGLGKAYAALHQDGQALHYLNAAIALDPQCDDAWYNRALIFKNSQNYDVALHDLAIPISHNYGPAVFRRAEIHRILHQDLEAAQDEARITNTFLHDN